MASWQEFATDAPALAEAARERFSARKHHTMATLRRDGSPRISGTEVQIRDGQLWLGSMPGSRKGADLRRDGRLALHSASEDPPDWRADARVAGRAVEVTDVSVKQAFAGTADEPAFDLFTVDIAEVVLVRLGEPADHLVIESWHEGRGVQRTERR